MKIHPKSTFIIVMITAFILSACQPNQANIQSSTPPVEQPISSNNATVFPKPADPLDSQERVYVENIQLNIMESFPLQVSATINGNLPDGCTSIINSEADFESNNNTFTIHIFSERPKDMDCTDALVPFTETIPLDVYGFLAGTYTVNAYQLSTTFKFESDNIIPD